MDYYQGYYFARPVTLEQSDIPSSRLSVIRGLNLIMADAELGELEALINRDAGLSDKLLRYINCAGLDGLSKIDSIRQAMVRMGRQQLYRLLTLLLFANEGEGPSSPLLLTAVQRGRLLEQLGQGSERATKTSSSWWACSPCWRPCAHADDAHCGRNGAAGQHIRAALLERSGPYAPYPALVEALERCGWAQMQRLAGELGMAREAINAAVLEALAYSEKLA
ncbi:MAG: HDOD domain-containing protein [Pseudomonadota bacterium]